MFHFLREIIPRIAVTNWPLACGWLPWRTISYGLLTLSAFIGCGPGSPEFPATSQEMGTTAQPSRNSVPDVSAVPATKVASREETELSNKPSVKRRVIYRATLDMIVEDLKTASNRLQQALDSHQGYIAQAKSQNVSQENPEGEWTVRVPVEHFTTFLNQLEQIGGITRQTIETDEVTDQYVDLQARIKNEKRLEERVLDLLSKAQDRMSAVLELEKEVSQIRENIERMEGRLRYMTDKTDFATITLAMQQRVEQQTPQLASFSQRVSESWASMSQGTAGWLQGILLFLIETLPRIVIAAVLLLVTWPLSRAWIRYFKTALSTYLMPPTTTGPTTVEGGSTN